MDSIRCVQKFDLSANEKNILRGYCIRIQKEMYRFVDEAEEILIDKFADLDDSDCCLITWGD